MEYNRAAITALSVALSIPTFSVQASPAVCNETAGGVIFKDTLYGIGIGGVLTGLGLLAAQNGNGQAIASGAFVGGVVGLGVGIVDIATRDCYAALKPYESRFSLAVEPSSGFGIGWSMALQ